MQGHNFVFQFDLELPHPLSLQYKKTDDELFLLGWRGVLFLVLTARMRGQTYVSFDIAIPDITTYWNGFCSGWVPVAMLFECGPARLYCGYQQSLEPGGLRASH